MDKIKNHLNYDRPRPARRRPWPPGGSGRTGRPLLASSWPSSAWPPSPPMSSSTCRRSRRASREGPSSTRATCSSSSSSSWPSSSWSTTSWPATTTASTSRPPSSTPSPTSRSRSLKALKKDIAVKAFFREGNYSRAGDGGPAEDLRLPLAADQVRVHRPRQEPRPGQALRGHPGRHDHLRVRRQGQPHHDDDRGGRDQRHHQGHPGDEEDHLLPRGPRRGLDRGERRERLFLRQGRAREAGLRGQEADPGPFRGFPGRLRPARRPRPEEGPSARTRSRPSRDYIERGAAASSSWSIRRPTPASPPSSPATASSSRTTSSSTRSPGSSAAITSCRSSANTRRHEITKSFRYATFFPYARSVEATETKPEGSDLTVIARTSPNSWSERQLDQKQVKFDKDKDKQGPISLALVATLKAKAGRRGPTRTSPAPRRPPREGAADRRSATRTSPPTDTIDLSGNGNFFLNTVNWLTEEADLISIQPKTSSPRTIQLSPSQGRLLFFVSVILLPLSVLVLGLAVWLRRRSL